MILSDFLSRQEIDKSDLHEIIPISFDKKAILNDKCYIRINNPTLNQNIGKYNLNHIWDRVLFNTPGLRLGSS